jgi:hypothetical protein
MPSMQNQAHDSDHGLDRIKVNHPDETSNEVNRRIEEWNFYRTISN